MIMSTTHNALLAVLLLAATATKTANANDYHYGMTTANFVENAAAVAYNGHHHGSGPVTVQFLSSPGLDWHMNAMEGMKSTMVRFEHLIDFQPVMEIIPGHDHPMNCRPTGNNAEPEPLSELCEEHCMNNGRYCDQALMIIDMDGHHEVQVARRRHFHEVKGHDLVEEAARRLCVWDLYGKDSVIQYFQYHEAMKATACDAHLTEACIEQVLRSVDMDHSKIHDCIQGGQGDKSTSSTNSVGLGPTLVGRNKILELAPGQLSAIPPPMLFINHIGFDMEEYSGWTGDHGWSATNMINVVCDNAFDERGSDNDEAYLLTHFGERPLVCDFCNTYCPARETNNRRDNRTLHSNTCMWELKCESGHTFDDFLVSKNLTAAGVIQDRAVTKPKEEDHNNNNNNGNNNNNVNNNNNNNNNANNNNANNNNANNNNNNANNNNNVKAPAAASSSSSTGAAAAAGGSPSGNSSKSMASQAGGVAATFLGMVLTAGLLVLAVMGIRVYRTKVIIERYVREQEELSMSRMQHHDNYDGGSGNNDDHRDSAFFPDENELDLDLEPALQYSDHISSSTQTSRGPSHSTFLPKLT